MIIIADTSPLNYLILIGAVDLLPALYKTVHIGESCVAELVAPGASEEVRRWIRNRPSWLIVSTQRRRAVNSGT